MTAYQQEKEKEAYHQEQDKQASAQEQQHQLNEELPQQQQQQQQHYHHHQQQQQEDAQQQEQGSGQQQQQQKLQVQASVKQQGTIPLVHQQEQQQQHAHQQGAMPLGASDKGAANPGDVPSWYASLYNEYMGGLNAWDAERQGGSSTGAVHPPGQLQQGGQRFPATPPSQKKQQQEGSSVLDLLRSSGSTGRKRRRVESGLLSAGGGGMLVEEDQDEQQQRRGHAAQAHVEDAAMKGTGEQFNPLLDASPSQQAGLLHATPAAADGGGCGGQQQQGVISQGADGAEPSSSLKRQLFVESAELGGSQQGMQPLQQNQGEQQQQQEEGVGMCGTIPPSPEVEVVGTPLHVCQQEQQQQQQPVHKREQQERMKGGNQQYQARPVVPLPSPSELDPQVLAALPMELRAELERAYGGRLHKAGGEHLAAAAGVVAAAAAAGSRGGSPVVGKKRLHRQQQEQQHVGGKGRKRQRQQQQQLSLGHQGQGRGLASVGPGLPELLAKAGWEQDQHKRGENLRQPRKQQGEHHLHLLEKQLREPPGEVLLQQQVEGRQQRRQEQQAEEEEQWVAGSAGASPVDGSNSGSAGGGDEHAHGAAPGWCTGAGVHGPTAAAGGCISGGGTIGGVQVFVPMQAAGAGHASKRGVGGLGREVAIGFQEAAAALAAAAGKQGQAMLKHLPPEAAAAVAAAAAKSAADPRGVVSVRKDGSGRGPSVVGDSSPEVTILEMPVQEGAAATGIAKEVQPGRQQQQQRQPRQLPRQDQVFRLGEQQRPGSNLGPCHQGSFGPARQLLTLSEVDPEVLAELPFELQQELLAALPPRKGLRGRGGQGHERKGVGAGGRLQSHHQQQEQQRAAAVGLPRLWGNVGGTVSRRDGHGSSGVGGHVQHGEGSGDVAVWEACIQQCAAALANGAPRGGACGGKEEVGQDSDQAAAAGKLAGAAAVYCREGQLSRLADQMVQWLLQHDYDLSLVTKNLRDVSQLQKLQQGEGAVVGLVNGVVCRVQEHVQTKFGFKLRVRGYF